MVERLSILSYNSRGFDSCKQDFLKLLSVAGGVNTILCNQENFILKANEYIIRKTLPNHHIFFKAAIKDSLEGRPKNGMFVAIPEHFKEIVTDVSPLSDRLQSLLIKFSSSNILLLNSYFPTDPKTCDFNDTELQLLLNQIKETINDNDFDQLIWTGDINTDFHRNTNFVKIVEDFIEELGLKKSWDEYHVDYTHTFERDNSTFTSTLDHFFWNETLFLSVTDAGVLHVPDNMSDHLPIYCNFTIPQTKFRTRHNQNPKPNSSSTYNWKRADDDQKKSYYVQVEERLHTLDLPVNALSCQDVHCKNPDHISDLDHLMLDTLKIIEESISCHIPRKKEGKTSKERIPSWKKDIEPIKDNAYFWHSVWVSANRPLNCVLHSIMKKTRNKYHLAIRKNRRISDLIQKDNLLSACMQNQCNLFDAIKRQRKSVRSCPTSLDGRTENIPAYLSGKYKDLYNSCNDIKEVQDIETHLEFCINESSMNVVERIKWEDMKRCSQKLKVEKNDPSFNVSSDSLKGAPDIMYKTLTLLLKSYITHGHVSSFLLVSTLIPIIKNKLGDSTDSNNYRSIAISSLILKLFDLVILSSFEKELALDDLQFAYQTQVSTSMCTWTAIETITYFQRNGSSVYSCLMDMSKAFDNVKHSVLFKKLLDQGLPSIIVRYILVTYKHQKANVRWNGEISEFFKVTNGVKQGAILSAILYCVYTNELFQELRQKRVGCTINQIYLGCLGYADDLLLLSPTIDGLQYMLNVCESYAERHNLTFSTHPDPKKSKTKCIPFTLKKSILPKLKLSGNELPWVEGGKHLGIKIQNKRDNILGQDIKEKRAQFIQRTNEILQEFFFASPATKLLINRLYNSHFTGSVIWDLWSTEANMVYNSWSTSIRKIFGLDRATHRYLIEPVSKSVHLKTNLLIRFQKFTTSLRNSNKEVVKSLYTTLIKDCRSRIGRNQRMLEVEMMRENCANLKELKFSQMPPKEEWRLGVIEDLINARDNIRENQLNWSKDDLSDALCYVCSS